MTKLVIMVMMVDVTMTIIGDGGAEDAAFLGGWVLSLSNKHFITVLYPL